MCGLVFAHGPREPFLVAARHRGELVVEFVDRALVRLERAGCIRLGIRTLYVYASFRGIAARFVVGWCIAAACASACSAVKRAPSLIRRASSSAA